MTVPISTCPFGTAKESRATVPDLIESTMATPGTAEIGAFWAVVPAGGSDLDRSPRYSKDQSLSSSFLDCATGSKDIG